LAFWAFDYERATFQQEHTTGASLKKSIMLLRSEGSTDVVLLCDGGSLSALDGGSGRPLAEVATAD
jgi:hypothetical protein